MSTAETIEYPYPFTEEESQAAFDEWGANCGPNALAVCVGKSLEALRPIFDQLGFPAKKYTNPTMMRDAVRLCGYRIVGNPHEFPLFGLVRVQWTGPWTVPGVNPRWAYRHTHWIHSRAIGGERHVFDCNGGWRSLESWRDDIAPVLANSIPRADGGFTTTHRWGLAR